jgi:1,4-alpha-glucan branching enzyme
MKSSRSETCNSKSANTLFFERKRTHPTQTAPQQQSNRNTTKRANGTGMLFTLDRPEAQIVYLSGDFNEWSPRSLRMFRRGASGPWERRVPLEPGRYQYKFMVDGEWIHDPAARENTPNLHGSLNSVIEVRGCRQDHAYDHAPPSIQAGWRND